MSNAFQTKLQDIVERLDSRFRVQGQRDIEQMQQAGVNSYDDLLAVLQDQTVDTDTRTTACWLLARLGNKQAVPVLLAALRDENPYLRGAAARSLGELDAKQAVQPLINLLLTDEEVEVRELAAYALGWLDDERAVEPLVNMLSDQSQEPRVRGMAAEPLANLRNSRAMKPLITALADASGEVRFWAAFALGQLGDPQALPELERLAATDKAILPGWWAVKEEAAAAIQHIQECEAERDPTHKFSRTNASKA